MLALIAIMMEKAEAMKIATLAIVRTTGTLVSDSITGNEWRVNGYSDYALTKIPATSERSASNRARG